MGVFKEKDHKIRVRYVVSKYWPERSGRVRRYAPTHEAAKRLLNRIETSICDGTWRELKEELEGTRENLTIREFYERFMEEYCKVHLKPKSWKRYKLSFKTLNKSLGRIPLEDFHRKHLHRYVQIRKRQVSNATVNRDIAAIKKMCSYALEVGVVASHPLIRFKALKEEKKRVKPLSVEEFRCIVESADRPSLAAAIAVMGETAIRLEEALTLQWKHVDLRTNTLLVEKTKNWEGRDIPLSEYAVKHLSSMVRYIHCPYVFVNERSQKRWVNPYKALHRACDNAGIEKISFHDFRRFRATQWLSSGLDIRTVKELLGHKDIATTMKYISYLPDHALSKIREIQRLEEIQAQQERNRRQSK